MAVVQGASFAGVDSVGHEHYMCSRKGLRRLPAEAAQLHCLTHEPPTVVCLMDMAVSLKWFHLFVTRGAGSVAVDTAQRPPLHR